MKVNKAKKKMKEQDEQFSGNELDELGDETNKSIPKQQPIEKAEKKYKGKGRVWLFIAIGLSLLSGVGYFYMKEEMPLVTSNQKEGPERFAIPKDQLLVFESFVIPFKQSKKFTYISLAITFKLCDKKLMGEMIQEKNRLRGIIYDMLTEEINGMKDVPSLEKLKKCIIRAVNGALSMGRIKEAYITDLLAV